LIATRIRIAARAAASLLAGLAAVLLVAPAARAEEQTWYAETLTSSPRGVNTTQYWSKGNDRMRAETAFAGHRLITIVNGKTYYALDLNSGQGVAIERSKRALDEAKKRKRLVGLEGLIIRERGGEKVKSEMLGSRKVDVWKNTDSRGRQEVWIQQDGPEDVIPLRVEVYSRQAGAAIRTDYVSWIEGLALPDRMFEPDPRIPLEKFSYDEFLERGDDAPRVLVLHGNLLHGEK